MTDTVTRTGATRRPEGSNWAISVPHARRPAQSDHARDAQGLAAEVRRSLASFLSLRCYRGRGTTPIVVGPKMFARRDSKARATLTQPSLFPLIGSTTFRDYPACRHNGILSHVGA